MIVGDRSSVLSTQLSQIQQINDIANNKQKDMDIPDTAPIENPKLKKIHTVPSEFDEPQQNIDFSTLTTA